MNAGTLNAWNTMTVPERITFNGGKIQQGNPNRQLLTLTGYLTLNALVTVSSGSITTGVEAAGFVDGPGGFTMDQGWIYMTGNTNTYSGQTVVEQRRALYVGKTNLYAGLLARARSPTTARSTPIRRWSRRPDREQRDAQQLHRPALLRPRGEQRQPLLQARGDAFTLTNSFAGGGTIFQVNDPSLHAQRRRLDQRRFPPRLGHVHADEQRVLPFPRGRCKSRTVSPSPRPIRRT